MNEFSKKLKNRINIEKQINKALLESYSTDIFEKYDVKPYMLAQRTVLREVSKALFGNADPENLIKTISETNFPGVYSDIVDRLFGKENTSDATIFDPANPATIEAIKNEVLKYIEVRIAAQ